MSVKVGREIKTVSETCSMCPPFRSTTQF